MIIIIRLGNFKASGAVKTLDLTDDSELLVSGSLEVLYSLIFRVLLIFFRLMEESNTVNWLLI